MKQVLLFILFIPILLGAQNISVSSFSKLSGDLDARVNHSIKDQNGDKCAIIKVVTTQKGFKWEGDALGIVSASYKTGEYWLYVPHGARILTIKHEQLGILRNYRYTSPIKEATVYELVLTTKKVITTVEDFETPTQWVVVTSFPDSASIYINNEYKGKTTFQQELPLGKYSLQLDYPMYHTKYDDFILDEPNDKKIINSVLLPDFGSIKLTSYPENGAKVFIDGEYTGKTTPCTLDKVKNEKHLIQLSHEWYVPTKKEVTIVNSNIKELEVRMVPNFATVQIDVDAKTSVFMDDKLVSKGSWKGRVLKGFHVFEVKKDKHRNDVVKLDISASSKIDLTIRPKPIYGKLKITTYPYDAVVLIDGISYGNSPVTIPDLLIGEYTLVLEKQGFGAATKTINIVEGEVFEVNENLPRGKKVTISAKSRKTLIYVDGVRLGYSPVTKTLSFGKHKISLDRGGEEYSREFEVSDKGDSNLYFITDADALLDKADNTYKNGRYEYSQNKYEQYLELYPNGDRSNYVARRLNKLYNSKQEKNSYFMYYHFDKVSQFSFGGGYLDKNEIGWYGAFKMGIGDMEYDYTELNMYAVGGITYKIFYPLWFNLGLGTGFRSIYNFDVDGTGDDYEYDKWEIFPEVGLNIKISDFLFLKYGIQYNNKDGGIMSQFGIGVTFDSLY